MISRRSGCGRCLRGAFGEPYLYAVETASTQDVLRDGGAPARRRRGRGAPDGRPRPLGPPLGGRAARHALALLRPARAAGGAPRCRNSRSSPALAVAVALEREAGCSGAREVAQRRPRRRRARWRGSCSRPRGAGSSAGSGSTSTRSTSELPRETRAPADFAPARGRDGASTAASCSPRCWTSSSAATQAWLDRGLAGLADRARAAERARRRRRPRRRPPRHRRPDRRRRAAHGRARRRRDAARRRAARWRPRRPAEADAASRRLPAARTRLCVDSTQTRPAARLCGRSLW